MRRLRRLLWLFDGARGIQRIHVASCADLGLRAGDVAWLVIEGERIKGRVIE